MLDDFHYADLKMQMYMAQQFKDAIRKGFKVIIASLPHRSDDAVRTNPDLQGCISIIDIEAWTKDEQREIPVKGFAELSADISEVNIDRLAEESIRSPQLMQLICLNICILKNMDEGQTEKIKNETIEKSFRFSTLNLYYEKIANIIRQGKNPRGKSRKSYQTAEFGQLDLYGLILEAIAVDPPAVSVSFDGLMSRILSLISGEEKKNERIYRLRNVLNGKNDEKLIVLANVGVFTQNAIRYDIHLMEDLDSGNYGIFAYSIMQSKL